MGVIKPNMGMKATMASRRKTRSWPVWWSNPRSGSWGKQWPRHWVSCSWSRSSAVILHGRF